MTEKTSPDPDEEKARARREQELIIQRRIAFASGMFQGDITVRTLLESIGEGIVIIDRHGTILLVNARAEQMFGYSRDEIIGKPHSLVIPDRLRAVHEKHMAQYFEEPKIRPMGHGLDLAGRRRDGSEFPVEISLSFLETINGIFVVAFVSDISLRKEAESHLRESEQRFASLMEHLPAAAWMKDMHGRYAYANAEAERIFSQSLPELRGKSDEEVFPPDVARQFRHNDQLALAENRCVQTTEILRQADGIDHYSVVNKFPVPGPDGRAAYVVGVAFDITERVRVEEALQKSEEKFSMIFNTAPVGITISTLPDGRFVDINAAGERFSGYRRDEVIGRTSLEFEIWRDPLERARMVEEVLKKGGVRDREMMMKDKGGNVFWASYSAVIVEIRGEKYLLSLVSDITGRRRAEEDIVRLNTDLAARAAELEEANRDLEAFNYTVAHDLRKPLATVNGYCQMLLELCGERLGDECRSYLQEVYDGTWRMNRLIDTLLNFSRMAGIEPRRETVDLSVMAREVASELQLADPARRGTLRIAEGMSVIGDAGLLRIVLENLLGNAWKYTAMREEAVIEFGETDSYGIRTWFVRDNGAGFATEDADQLFTPFRRLPGAHEQAGFGIGLATVDRIIRRHGGRVWAEGEPGKGATFYFTLPGESVSA